MPAFRIRRGFRLHGTYVVFARWRLLVEKDHEPWQCPVCDKATMKIYVEKKSAYLWRRCDDCRFCLPAVWRMVGDSTKKLIAERTAWLVSLPSRLIAKIEAGWY